MLRRLMRRRIDAFGRQWDYDVSYMQWMLQTSPRVMRCYAGFLALAAWRGTLPVGVWHAARIAAARAGDCGPCVQLVVQMAEADGVPAEVLRALLDGDPAAMDADTALGWRFARAALSHAPEADELREAITARWGAQGVLAAGLAVATSSFFPTLKYALGHGHTCRRVAVGGEEWAPRAR